MKKATVWLAAALGMVTASVYGFGGTGGRGGVGGFGGGRGGSGLHGGGGGHRHDGFHNFHNHNNNNRRFRRNDNRFNNDGSVVFVTPDQPYNYGGGGGGGYPNYGNDYHRSDGYPGPYGYPFDNPDWWHWRFHSRNP